MKKFMTVLTILFVFTLGMFAQKVAITTNFNLMIDDTFVPANNDLFDVTYNPISLSNPNGGGFVIVNFYDVFDNVILDNIGAAFMIHDEVFSYADSDNSKGCYMVRINYQVSSDNDVMIKVNTSTYVAPQFSGQDTVNSYDNGYNKGQDEFVCDFTQDDVTESYENGVVFGTDLTVNVNDYQAGFEAGKESCGTNGVSMSSDNMGVSVYPIPSNGYVSVDCPNISKVVILTITGQIINTVTDNFNNISTTELVTGVYFFNVHDTDGNASTTKVLVN